MHPRIQVITALVLASLLALIAADGAAAQQPKAKQEPRNTTRLELMISRDGHAIIDQNGKVIARFVEGKRVQMSVKGVKAIDEKLPGCMCCEPECVKYEHGECVQSIESCTWDFDCSCR